MSHEMKSSVKYPTIRHRYGDWVIWRKLTGCRQFWQARNKVTLQYVNLSDPLCHEWTIEHVKTFVDNPDNVAENAENRARFSEESVRRINALFRQK
jgi:hypothetical protein